MSKTIFPLNDGRSIPAVGLGTWQSKPNEVRDAVKFAIQHGYRHIDTALNYGNEKEVGEGIRASGVAREDIWVTTKLDNPWHHRVVEGFAKSLSDLDIGYIDLYLMHFPCSTDPEDSTKHLPDWDYVKTWQEMQKLLDAGKVRSIGVSNFQIRHLEKLLADPSCKVVPAVNQIEVRQTTIYDHRGKVILNGRLTWFHSFIPATRRMYCLTPSFCNVATKKREIIYGQSDLIIDPSSSTFASPRASTARPTPASVARLAHPLTTLVPSWKIQLFSRLPQPRVKRRSRLCKSPDRTVRVSGGEDAN
jgi:hypothetical protein